jgi:hypothetical protein
MKPGNPIHGYMKCIMTQHPFFFNKEAFERREKLLEMPLEELPAREVDEYGQIALRQVDLAARLDRPDWEILLKLKADGIGTLLPEVQQMRSLARALQARLKVEVAQGRFGDALRTATTMVAMARHLGEHPTFIGDLVGVAIAYTCLVPLEEMLAQPGCPNLYWAFTNLPRPLIPLTQGIEGERMVELWVFRDLDDGAPMSAQALNKFIKPLDELFESGGLSADKHTLRAWLDSQIKDQSKVSAARRRLVAQGLAEERLKQFPAEQVILLDEKRELEVRFDDMAKLINFSFWEYEELARQAKPNPARAVFADAILPAIANVRRAQARLDQRVALLRQVEALRLHAADHQGALPARLAEISVPLPLDPITGKSFRYQLEGRTAHIRGSPPRGEEQNAAFNMHYEVTVEN